MASLPPVMRPNFDLPFGAVQKAIKLIAPGFPVYFLGLVVTYIIVLLPTGINYLIQASLHPGRNPFLDPDPPTSSTLTIWLLSLAVSVPAGLINIGLQKTALEQIKTGSAPKVAIPSLNGRGKEVAFWFLILGLCYSLISLPMLFALKGYHPQTDPSQVFLVLPAELLVFFFLDLLYLAVLLPPLLIVEKGLNPKEALIEGFQLIKPKFWMLFLALILSQLFAGLGVIACCVGFVFTCIIIFTFPAVVYDGLVAPASQTERPL